MYISVNSSLPFCKVSSIQVMNISGASLSLIEPRANYINKIRYFHQLSSTSGELIVVRSIESKFEWCCKRFNIIVFDKIIFDKKVRTHFVLKMTFVSSFVCWENTLFYRPQLISPFLIRSWLLQALQSDQLIAFPSFSKSFED